MQIALELPEDIAKHLETAWRDVSRGTLEAVAVEGYREGALTREQVGRLLGLSFWETEAFLKERQAYLAYTEEDLEQDRRNLDHLPKAALPALLDKIAAEFRDAPALPDEAVSRAEIYADHP